MGKGEDRLACGALMARKHAASIDQIAQENCVRRPGIANALTE
jgi:hypothetical protein